MMKLIIALFLVAFTTIQAAEYLGLRPDQSIGVRGMLKCNGRPASNVLVKLYDHDSKFLSRHENLPCLW